MRTQPTLKVVTPPCPHCGKESEVHLTRDEFERVTALDEAGRPKHLIQDALPGRDADFREVIKTGFHPECWTAVMGDGEDEPGPEHADEAPTGYLLLPVEGPTSVLAVEDSLATLQRGVGGYVERVDVDASAILGEGRRLDMWLNDEGKFIMDNPRNELAQLLWDRTYGRYTDFILGPAVLTNTADEKGDTQPLSEDDITSIRAFFDQLGYEV